MQTQPAGETMFVQQGQMGQPQQVMMVPMGQQMGQPMGQPMMGQPMGQVVMVGQPMGQDQVVIMQPTRTVMVVNDDPTCLYVGAVVALFIPLVGLIMMCVFGCGNNLPQRQAVAFRVLVATTITAIVVYIIISATSGNWENIVHSIELYSFF